MTFGDELGANDEIEASLRHVVEFLAKTLDRFDQITRQNQDASLRKKFARFLFKPFDTGTNRSKAIGSVAIRTFRRRRHRKSTVMTDQPSLEAVVNQPGVAIRTLQTKSAGTAQR